MAPFHVLIIGAGFTGLAAAHDLALRGLAVTVVDRGPLVNGTSGRTHGLLHSGARYAVSDQESAAECIQEQFILRRIVPQAIEPNGGLFVALDDQDIAYGEKFEAGCAACGIQAQKLTGKEVLRLEPNLSPKVCLAFRVPEGTFDPLRLGMAFAASAQANGARFRLFTEVLDLACDGQGQVTGVAVEDRTNGVREVLRADLVVNAAGAWSGQVAHMAGAHVPIAPTPGVMVAVDRRLADHTVNRLRKPSDGDLALPQRRMMVIGTTSYAVEDPDYVPVLQDQVRRMLDCAAEMLPGFRSANLRGSYTATRPLIAASGTGRSLARTFKCFDHKETENLEGFITITGGKATTLRLMAEKVADMACQKLGVPAACRTAETPLVSYRRFACPVE